MKYIIMRLSLVAVLLLLSVSISAFEVDGINYNVTSFSDLTVEVSSKNPMYSGEVVIPESVNYEGDSYSVTEIGGLAFYGCSGLTSVTIGNSVTSIGSQAFDGCSGLTSVTIPNSVTKIGWEAFNSCSGLTSVTIPNSVTEIGGYAFQGCSGLTSVTIGNCVTTIGESAFEGCSSLTSVTLNCMKVSSWFSRMTSIKEIIMGDGVTTIGNYAFEGCSGLTSVTIPNSVTEIGYSAFEGCSGLTSVTIGNCVTEIGSCAFYSCSSLTSVTIGNCVTTIGESAFEGCSSLTSVTIPNSVTEIGKYAFYGCSGLTSLTIGNSVTSIGNEAFRACRSLTSVTIPNSVTSIGKYAFRDCTSLTSVTIGSGVKYYDTVFMGNAIDTIYFDAKEFDTSFFRSYYNTKITIDEVTLGENVERIEIQDDILKLRCLAKTPCPNYYAGDYHISNLEIPYGYSLLYAKDEKWNKIPIIYSVNDNTEYYPIPINYIGENVVSVNGNFEGYEAKEGEEVKIEAYSLNNKPLVMKATQNISNILSEKGSFTFKTSIYHSDNVIYTYDFPLTNITLSESGTLIDNVNIDNILDIENLKISGDINGTDLLVIRKMENLKLLDLGEAHIVEGGMSYYKNYTTSENKIGDNFFDNNRELYRIILPNDITEIKYGALTFCNRMKAITIPPSVVKISDTFYAHDDLSIQISDLSAWCKISFTSVIISVDVYQFRKGHTLFLNDKEIVDLVIPDGITSINDYSFFNVAGLRSITIPKSVVSIGKGALWSKVSDCIISLNPTPPEILSSTLYAQEGTTLYVPKGSKTLYWLHPYWEKFKNIVELDDTGINDVKFDVPKMSKGVYTIDGVKVSTNADNIESLPKGIYIVNGEKVILK